MFVYSTTFIKYFLPLNLYSCRTNLNLDRIEMATLFRQEGAPDAGDKQSIVDDFMYSSNVASSHVYVRMGQFKVFHFFI